jgi:hypothetical protein
VLVCWGLRRSTLSTTWLSWFAKPPACCVGLAGRQLSAALSCVHWVCVSQVILLGVCVYWQQWFGTSLRP